MATETKADAMTATPACGEIVATWQLIDSAPKDEGARFLVAYAAGPQGHYRVVIGERELGRIWSQVGPLEADDDMWMPLPAPPSPRPSPSSETPETRA